MSLVNFRRLPRGIFAGAFILVIAALVCSRVWAHASLLSSEPAEGAVLSTAPTQLVLHFNEPVAPIDLKIVDRSGAPVRDAATARSSGNDLILPLHGPLADGVYLVSYRVVSADTHPAAGAFGFFIGERSGEKAQVAQDAGSGVWLSAVGGIRWALYTLMLVALGSGAFLLMMRVPEEIARATANAGAAAAPLAGLCYLLSIGFGGGQLAGGSVAEVLSSRAWSLGASTTLGASAALGIPAMALLWCGFRLRKSFLLIAGIVLAVLSFLVTGHAATAKPVALMATMVALHLLCAAFWLGSLYPLFRATRLPVVQEGGLIMLRFSRFAVLSVVVLFASGVVISWVQLRSLSAFVTTDYGGDLLLKLALFAVLLGLAAYNKRVLTPQLVAGEAAGAQRIRHSIRAEYVLYVLILGAAASLTLNQPPRAMAADNDGTASVHSFSATAESNGYRAQVRMLPASAGETHIEVTVVDAQGQAVQLESMALTLSHAGAGIAGVEKQGERAGTAWHFAVSEMAIAGEWQLTIAAFITVFDTVDFHLAVPIQ